MGLDQEENNEFAVLEIIGNQYKSTTIFGNLRKSSETTANKKNVKNTCKSPETTETQEISFPRRIAAWV